MNHEHHMDRSRGGISTFPAFRGGRGRGRVGEQLITLLAASWSAPAPALGGKNLEAGASVSRFPRRHGDDPAWERRLRHGRMSCDGGGGFSRYGRMGDDGHFTQVANDFLNCTSYDWALVRLLWTGRERTGGSPVPGPLQLPVIIWPPLERKGGKGREGEGRESRQLLTYFLGWAAARSLLHLDSRERLLNPRGSCATFPRSCLFRLVRCRCRDE